VVTAVQRAGPSTGMPTKTEQADLLMAMYGRHGEAPLPILAACTPSDCFLVAYEAVRIAVKYMTPVILLTDGYLANGSEPWLIPNLDDLPSVPVEFRTDPTGFFPYVRDEETLSRPWVIPGTPELEHRVGGLEKDFLSGNVSYAPNNHEQMRVQDHALGPRDGPVVDDRLAQDDLGAIDAKKLNLRGDDRRPRRGDDHDGGIFAGAAVKVAGLHAKGGVLGRCY
jgi:2-oxoglutarate ferredoxin oxidoreductase subunit alpha